MSESDATAVRERKSLFEDILRLETITMGEEPHYKVCMLGDSGVGKTALVTRIAEGIFTETHVPTVGSQFIALPLEVDKRKITLELWDTAGQEVYRSLVGFYTRDAKGAFLVCDVTSEESFKGLGDWIKFVNDQAPDVEVIIFANKTDLESSRVVSKEELENFAASHNVRLQEGSAKLGKNTNDAFELMGELLIKAGEGNQAEKVNIDAGDDNGKKKKKCC